MADEAVSSIFRAYDIRGVFGRDLTPEVAEAIGRAIGSEARARGQQRVVAGRDGRLSGPLLHEALCRGLQATGAHVIDIGCVPTPLLYYAAYTLASGSGVMVTGSHNPPDYNGFKVLLGGETLSGAAIADLGRRVAARDWVSGDGSRSNADALEPYLARVLADTPTPLPYRVVLDSGNGAGGLVAPRLFRALGCEVIELFSEVDGTFPNHHPDPSQPENLTALRQAVRDHQADLGFAFDGDADRLGVVTGSGEVVWPDRLLMLFAQDLLSRQPGATVIHDVKCSTLLPRAIREAGGLPLLAPTGHSLIKAKMAETGALLAGELSGHLFFRERWFGFDDGIYAAVRLLELLHRLEGAPSELLDALPDALATPELRVPLAGEAISVMQCLLDDLQLVGDGALTTVDGVRVDYADCWGLVRASNTTPCLVLRFEADHAEAMARVQTRFRDALRRASPDLHISF